MRQINLVRELQNLSSVISLHHIQEWLNKYENEFHNAINSTTCRKWSKWLNNNEKPFPCVCSTREQDCIFIETYYKLNNVLALYEQNQYFKELVSQYELIKNDAEKIKSFTNNLKELGHNLFFETKIIISLNTEPYKKITLQLNENEFEGIIKFQTLYFKATN